MAKPPPLTFEEHSSSLNQLFLTLIDYKKVRYITIIENVVDDDIYAYVLDRLDAEQIDQSWFLAVVTRWFYGSSHKYPLSFEFAKLGQPRIQKLIKTFPAGAATRVIGKIFVYNLNKKPKIKKKKAIFIVDQPIVQI